jgi:tripartite-type tricarboxylate transporter receptor subunit TctC
MEARMVIQRRNLMAAGGLAVLASPSLALAQSITSSDGPLRLVVPWPPGGSTDLIARAFQPHLQEALRRPVLVENRPGASGATGAQEVARAAPDGATWLLAFDTEATNQTARQLPYRTLEAFAPLTLVATGPIALVAHQFAPFGTYADVTRAARRNPDALHYATSGVGGVAHVAARLLQQAGGYRMVHEPYPGGGPAAQAVVAGRVPLLMSNVVAVREHIRAGALKPLGVSTREATRHLPGTRPFAQQGAGDFEAHTWWALLGVAKTPEPLLLRMTAAMSRVLAEPEVKARIENLGADIVASSAEDCAAFLQAEIDKWGRVIRDNNIRADSGAG